MYISFIWQDNLYRQKGTFVKTYTNANSCLRQITIYQVIVFRILFDHFPQYLRTCINEFLLLATKLPMLRSKK